MWLGLQGLWTGNWEFLFGLSSNKTKVHSSRSQPTWVSSPLAPFTKKQPHVHTVYLSPFPTSSGLLVFGPPLLNNNTTNMCYN